MALKTTVVFAYQDSMRVPHQLKTALLQIAGSALAAESPAPGGQISCVRP